MLEYYIFYSFNKYLKKAYVQTLMQVLDLQKKKYLPPRTSQYSGIMGRIASIYFYTTNIIWRTKNSWTLKSTKNLRDHVIQAAYDTYEEVVLED